MKKEDIIRHFKWHKKRSDSLQHGFMRFSPFEDCTQKFQQAACIHNGKHTHYHCLQVRQSVVASIILLSLTKQWPVYRMSCVLVLCVCVFVNLNNKFWTKWLLMLLFREVICTKFTVTGGTSLWLASTSDVNMTLPARLLLSAVPKYRKDRMTRFWLSLSNGPFWGYPLNGLRVTDTLTLKLITHRHVVPYKLKHLQTPGLIHGVTEMQWRNVDTIWLSPPSCG